MNSTMNESQLLKLLAISIVDNPRSTIKELAGSVGISKATLHRFCKTRENLDAMLKEKACLALKTLIQVADKDYDDYLEGLTKLTEAHNENKEYLRFICGIKNNEHEACCQPYYKSIDAFFLRGQKAGAFKFEFGIKVLTEIYVMVTCGMIDSERRGRVAPYGISEILLNLFLNGILVED